MSCFLTHALWHGCTACGAAPHCHTHRAADGFWAVQLVLELGLQAPEADDNSPWAKGAVTFGAFILFGSVPLLSYIIAAEAGVEGDLLFGLCILFTLATIFILGAVSGHFSQVSTSRFKRVAAQNGPSTTPAPNTRRFQTRGHPRAGANNSQVLGPFAGGASCYARQIFTTLVSL